jgi:hypothetical protein
MWANEKAAPDIGLIREYKMNRWLDDLKMGGKAPP